MIIYETSNKSKTVNICNISTMDSNMRIRGVFGNNTVQLHPDIRANMYNTIGINSQLVLYKLSNDWGRYEDDRLGTWINCRYIPEFNVKNKRLAIIDDISRGIIDIAEYPLSKVMTSKDPSADMHLNRCDSSKCNKNGFLYVCLMWSELFNMYCVTSFQLPHPSYACCACRTTRTNRVIHMVQVDTVQQLKYVPDVLEQYVNYLYWKHKQLLREKVIGRLDSYSGSSSRSSTIGSDTLV